MSPKVQTPPGSEIPYDFNGDVLELLTGAKRREFRE